MDQWHVALLGLLNDSSGSFSFHVLNLSKSAFMYAPGNSLMVHMCMKFLVL